MFDSDPLIVTAALDPESQHGVEELRTLHFPPALNVIPAHLTLFHNLPGLELARVAADLRGRCAPLTPLAFTASRTRLLGRGVALEIDCRRLVDLRRSLAELWRSWLTAQDQQGYKPHVTVQNKVTPAEARRLRAELAATLPPRSGTVVGLKLWRYRQGPWEAVATFGFDAAPDGAGLTPPEPAPDGAGR